MKWNIRPMTYEALTQAANPQSANVPETVPWYFYDTQTYVDNTTTELTFFAAAQNDQSLSNWGIGGVLPQPQFFRVESLMLDIVSTTATVFVTTSPDVTGVINDIGLLLQTGRPRVTLSLSGKQYGPWPLSLLHGTGGPNGFLSQQLAGAVDIQYANNGVFDGGLFVGGQILIPPQVDFNVRVVWPAAVNITADHRLRITMAGTLYRRVS